MVHNTYWSVVGLVVGALGFSLGLACLPCFSFCHGETQCRLCCRIWSLVYDFLAGVVGWLVGLFGVFVWPFHGYREVCCMVFLTGISSGYLGGFG
jgi:hypothetical protein